MATAGALDGLARAGRSVTLRALTRIQDAVAVLLLLATIFLNGWAFPVRSAWVVAGALAFLVALGLALRLRDPLQRLWVPSAIAILLFNFVLEGSFYPQLSRYQPGSEFARRALALQVDWDRFYFLGENIYQPFQFYTGHLVPAVSLARIAGQVADGKPAFALVGAEGRAMLEREGLRVRELIDSPACRITMVRWPMLDPRTRDTACPRAHLLEVAR